MSATVEEAMSNARRVAAVLLSIDGRAAARVLHGLLPGHFEDVTSAMAELRADPIDADTRRDVLATAMRRLQARPRSLGEVTVEPADTPEKTESPDASGTDDRHPSLAVFERLHAVDLVNLLANEHPQIAAVFIAHLDLRKAAAVIRELPEGRRPDLVYRIATLDRTPTHVIARVLEALAKKVDTLRLTSSGGDPQTWIKTAAEILKHVGHEQSILETIGESNEAIAASIRAEMFTFDNLELLDRKSMQHLLGRINTHTLALALRTTTPQVEANVFDNLSKRAGEMVVEDRDRVGPVRISDVIAAQSQILDVARRLADDGVIQPPRVVSERMV